MSWTAGVIRTVLPNGLTLLIQQDRSAPVVAVVTHVRAGYFDEPDRWVGIAHVLEHMFFKGSVRRGPGELARQTQLLGGYLNASTIYDKTVYYTVLPTSNGGLQHAVDLQADALMHLALDPGELSRELEVIVQEAKRKLDNPTALASETLYELLFRVHRMRRWRIGTEQGLRQLTAADLREYYSTRYAPDRTIVALVGDLDVDAAAALAQDTYGGWAATGGPVDGSPPEPEGQSPQARVLRGDIEAPMAVIGWRTVDALHHDLPALEIAAAVLGTGRGSWLYQEIRRPGLATGVQASQYSPADVGVFDLLLETDPAHYDQAVVAALAQVDRLARSGPSDSDLSRVRAMLATRWARRLEGMDGRATAFSEFEALGGVQLTDHFFRQLMAVTRADVQRVARVYLDPRVAAAVFYLPPDVTTQLEVGWPPKSGAAAQRPNGAAGPNRSETPIDGPRSPSTAKIERRPVVHRALPGVDLLVRAKPGAGLVSLGLYVPHLRELETPETAGMSWLLARSALRGAAGLSSEQLALAAESLGGAVAAAASLDAVGWSMTIRPDAVPEAARLLSSLALEPALTADDLAIERALQAEDAQRERDDMFRYPVQRVLAHAFPGDPYGLPGLGDPEHLRDLSDEVVRDLSRRLHGRRAVLVLVGEGEPDQLLDQLSVLERWPANQDRRVTPSPAPWTGGRGAESREKAQSALAMAFPAAPYASEDRFTLDVTSALLSGLAGRLFQALREERSLAYTVTASAWIRRRAGAMLAYIATSPEREDEARAAMLEELARLKQAPVSPAELERARNFAAGSVQLQEQTAATIGAELLEAWIHGVLDQLEAVPARLRAVTADDIARVAAGVFEADRRAEYVVRGTGRGR